MVFIYHIGELNVDLLEQLEEARKWLEDRGVYALVTTPEEVDYLKNNYDEMIKVMNRQILKRMRKWLDILIERIDLKKTSVIVMPGNDDIFEIDEVIKEYEDHGIIYPLNKVIEISGIEMISFDYVNPTPWNTPREADENRLKSMIKGLINKLNDPSKAIFNFHSRLLILS